MGKRCEYDVEGSHVMAAGAPPVPDDELERWWMARGSDEAEQGNHGPPARTTCRVCGRDFQNLDEYNEHWRGSHGW